MRSMIGGGFSKQLTVRVDDVYYFLRSTQDMKHMYNDIRSYVQSATQDEIDALYETAHQVPLDCAKLIETVQTYSDEQLLENAERVIADVKHVVLYNTTLPYFLAQAIEATGDHSFPYYDRIEDEVRVIRNTSLFHDLDEHVLSRLFRVVAKARGLEADDVAAMTEQELVAHAQRSGEKAGRVKVESRHVAALCTIGVSPDFFCTDEVLVHELIEATKHASKHEDDTTRAVTGTPAYAGVRQGIVRIINKKTDMHKINDGEILVAHTTSPVLMPAIKKAAALVTDEGGIGCHAAIVSRELKKPCIIGTKVATQVLHDGDLVEVDANTGTITQL
jgi:phosphoenolpyruvate synthase/pyruvate phosphate dikinase